MSDEWKKIYLSYARKDDPEFTERLYLDLTAAGFSVWMDKYDVPSRGVPYNKEMIDAIEHAERLLLVVGPEALTSDYVNWEWKHAVEFGKAINQVLRKSGYKDLPYELKKLDAPDFREDKNYQKSFEKLTHQLKEPPAILGKLIGVPLLAPNFLILTDKIKIIEESLLADIHRPVVVTGTKCITGVHGMGGIGKTEIAKAIARNPEVRRVFPDGIFWIEIGQKKSEHSLISIQSEIAKILGEPNSSFVDLQQGRMGLSGLLSDKACLFILDDVWDYEHTKAFDVLGPRCRMLVTTRDTSIITALGATEHKLNILSDDDALELLASWVGQKKEELPIESKALIKECENLPLAISLCGACIHDGKLWSDLIYFLQHIELEKIQHADRAVIRAIKTSVDFLKPFEAKKYLSLAAFPEDKQIPEYAVLTLWCHINGISEPAGRDLIDKLKNWNLIQLEGKEPPRKISLHDLQYDFVRSSFTNPHEPHENIIEAYSKKCNGEWHKGPDDGYFFSHLAYHFAQAGKKQEIEKLLFNFKWLQARLDATDIYGLIDDFDYLKEDKDARLVKGALQLSIHALTNDKRQLAGQLLGRLLDQESEKIQRLLKQAKKKKDYPWLRPIRRSMQPPGSVLIMTLAGHQDRVNSVALFPNGKKAISASLDNTLKIWDLESGKELKTLEGHTNSVTSVAIFSNGEKAISTSWDTTIKIWDLAKQKEIKTLRGHTDSVNAIAIFPKDKKAISASDDTTLKVWDLESGKELKTLRGHTDHVNSVELFPDGKKALSVAEDNTFKIWDLNSGKELKILAGHTTDVQLVAILPDGKKVLLKSMYGTLEIWDLEHCIELLRFHGHTEEIDLLVIFPNGKKAISSSGDDTLIIWDLENGKELSILAGYTSQVSSIAIFPSGYKAIFGSWDHTLKIWDLRDDVRPKTIQGKTGGGTLIAIAPKNKKVISVSGYETIKVWALKTGKELKTLIGDNDGITSIAIFPDGKKAILASIYGTLKIWDLEHGTELLTLTGNAGWISSVAISPDGRRVISASNNSLIRPSKGPKGINIKWEHRLDIWDIENNIVLKTLDGHTKWINSVKYFSDGKKVISASNDRTLIIWDIVSFKKIKTLKGSLGKFNSVAVFPNCKRVIASEDGKLIIWEYESGKKLKFCKEYTSWIYEVLIWPGGKRVLTLSNDKTLRLWDLKSDVCITTHFGDSFFDSCNISSDGKIIVASEASGAIHFLRLEMPDEE